MFDNFTDSTKELIYSAQNLAMSEHNTLIEPIHILNAMAKSEIESINNLFQELKLNTNIFYQDIQNILKNLAKTQEINNQIYFSKTTLSLFEKSSEKAKSLKDKFVSPEHILLAMSEVNDVDFKRIIEKYQITENKILNAMKKIIN